MPSSSVSLSSSASGPAASALGGRTIAQILQHNCPGLNVVTAVVIEYLDAQVGTWQCSVDGGLSWRAVRTDIINRPGSMGLALDRDALLRVLPFVGQRSTGARLRLHPVPYRHGPGNGSYRAYAVDDREEGSPTLTMVLPLSAINGEPPAVRAPRPRNKRALLQAKLAAGQAAQEAVQRAMA